MALTSLLFSGVTELENCAAEDRFHIASGRGDYIKRIQQALKNVDGSDIVDDGAFGNLTGNAVFNFKNKWTILGPGQTKPDRVVGRKTIAKLDEMQADFESRNGPAPKPLPVVGTAGVHVANIRGQNLIASYYRNCGLETIGPARISTSAPTTFGTLEDLIDHLGTSTEPHQIVVVHGNTTDGLLIPFSKETAFNKTALVMGSLSALADIVDSKGTINKTDPVAKALLSVATTMGVSQDAVIRVATKLKKVRQKRFVMHFRACNLGDPLVVVDYKKAFGAAAITFHGCRLFFLQIKPAQAKPGVSILDIHKTDTRTKRFRTTIDVNMKLHPIIMGIQDVDGHSHVRDETIMQVKTTDEIKGWAEFWLDRWVIQKPEEFVVPVMWENSELTFHFPLELGWRGKIQVI